MKRLLILMLFFTNIQTFSQHNLQEKYWYYRKRLNDYFVVIGRNPGESLCVERRNEGRICDGNAVFDQMSFGDGGIQQGWYISVLATEYALLVINNQPVNSTLRELAYALEAYKRLDNCESKEPWNKNNNILNGFFNRHDVELYNEEIDLNNWNKNLQAGEDYHNQPPGDPSYVSKCSLYGKNIDISEAMSQDQVVGMLMGLALVKKVFKEITFSSQLVDGQYGFYDFDGTFVEYDFLNQAKNIAHLLMTKVKNNDLWNITDPDGHMVVTAPGADGHYSGITLPNAYGFAKAGEYITGINYQTEISYATINIWLSQIFPNHNQDYNTTMAMALAAIGDSWGVDEAGLGVLTSANCEILNAILPAIVDPLTGTIVPPLPPGLMLTTCTILAAKATRGTAKNLKEAGEEWDRQYLYIPLLMYLHNKEINDPDIYTPAMIEKMLASAPCRGPYCWGNMQVEFSTGIQSGIPEGGWAYPNKFRATMEEQYGNHSFKGNFSGLDYMLLYNLYHLLENPEPYVNCNNRIVTGAYPQSVNKTNNTIDNFMGVITEISHSESYYEIGSDAHPLTIRSIDKIESTAKLDNIEHHTEINKTTTTITTPLSPMWCTESVSNVTHCAFCLSIGYSHPSCWAEHYIRITDNEDLTDLGYMKSNVTLIAKNKIVLKPGFIAKRTSHFIAKIESNYCSTNIYKQISLINNYDSAYWNSSKIILYPEQKVPFYKKIKNKENKENKENIIKIYPNPAKDIIMITISNEIISKTYITNSTGELVSKQTGNKKYFDISYLKSGLYIVKIITENNNIYYKKLIIK